MDTNNWRLTQGGEPLTDTGDWRSQLQADSRQAIVNKIMETLKRHIPVPGQELKEIAVRFEEKIFTAATSESEYRRKISLKMLAMDTKSQNPISNLLQSNSANEQNQPNLGPTNQSQAGKQQDVPDQQQQDVPQQRQQDVPQQQQQLSQNPQQYLYQQHLKNQLMKQKFQQGSISHSQMQSHIQQQQQQNLIQKNQLQSSQQSVLQPSMMQSSQLSSLQQKQLFQSQSAMPGESSSVMDTMDSGDWRRRLQVDSRQRIVNKIMETLKRHLPFSGREGLQELEKIAVRFEEKIYTAATNKPRNQKMAATRVIVSASSAATSSFLFRGPLLKPQQSLSLCFNNKNGRLLLASNKKRFFSCRALYKPDVLTTEEGQPETLDYRVFFLDNSGKKVSPWHDIPLQLGDGVFNFIVEIPKESSAKMEVATDEPFTPIKQDTKKGKLRYYPYNINWNYGLLPQTWEDPSLANPEVEGAFGDNDPVDVVEIGETRGKIGQILKVKPLGALAMIDEGELDWKIVAISLDDPKASLVNDVDDVEKNFPGTLTAIRDWFRDYKIPDGKPANKFGLGNKAANKDYALKVINETNESWAKLVKRSVAAGELSLV